MKLFAWLQAIVLAIALLVIAGCTEDGGPDNKVVLSNDQFTTFVAADAKFLTDALAQESIDKKTARKVLAAAALISAYADCSGHADRHEARLNATWVFESASNGSWITAKKFAGMLSPKITASRATFTSNGRKERAVIHYMYFFSSERVGGYGVESELEKMADSKDKITDSQFERLNELGLKIAVIGQTSEGFAPEKDIGAMTRKAWLARAQEMRQASQGLGAAAAAKNEANVRQSLKELDASCTNCHDVFR